MAELRAAAKSAGAAADEGEEEGTTSEMDIQKLQSALTAVTAAYGENSPQATAMAEDLKVLREDRQKAKPLSAQLRAAERRCGQKRKALDAARINATIAAEAVKEAQRLLVAADEKVVSCVTALREAETEEQKLSQRSDEETVASAGAPVIPPASFNEVAATMEGDEEGLRALEVARAKLAEKQRTREAPAPTQVPGTAVSSTTALALRTPSPMDVDVAEFERQAAMAERHAENAKERVENAKKARVA